MRRFPQQQAASAQHKETEAENVSDTKKQTTEK
jgi:hypothetical protein